MELYRGGLGANRNAGGLSLLPKLKYEHVYLTSFSKMRVDLAAQVMQNPSSGFCTMCSKFDTHKCFSSGEIRTAWKLLQIVFCALVSTLDVFSKQVTRRHSSNLQKPSKAAEFPACSHSAICSAATRQAAFLGVGIWNSSLPDIELIALFKSLGPLANNLALSSSGRSAEK